jgi:hypothetical protein
MNAGHVRGLCGSPDYRRASTTASARSERWTYTDGLLFFDTEVRVYFDNGTVTKIETVGLSEDAAKKKPELRESAAPTPPIVGGGAGGGSLPPYRQTGLDVFGKGKGTNFWGGKR